MRFFSAMTSSEVIKEVRQLAEKTQLLASNNPNNQEAFDCLQSCLEEMGMSRPSAGIDRIGNAIEQSKQSNISELDTENSSYNSFNYKG